MPKAKNVAAAIVEDGGPLDTLNLQKLLYYAQGWHLAWYDHVLFPERVQAWPIGPAVHEVYVIYRHFRYDPITAPEDGESSALSDDQRTFLRALLTVYPERFGIALALRTHEEEDPWLRARRGMTPAQWSTKEVSRAEMKKYFRSIPFGGEELPLAAAEDYLLSRAFLEGDGAALRRHFEESLPGVRLAESVGR